mmetsp:Transcript_12955/g.50687  ORF Transcript_12955/g.50687 Transcript_12955/m.50687 type:complete len:231 (-) Transcript_12955:331-1023(-)
MQCAALSPPVCEPMGETGESADPKPPGEPGPPPLSYPPPSPPPPPLGDGSCMATSESGLAGWVTSHSWTWQSARSAARRSRGGDGSAECLRGDGTCAIERMARAPANRSLAPRETTFHSLASVAGLSSATGARFAERASRIAILPPTPPNATILAPTAQTLAMPSRAWSEGGSATVAMSAARTDARDDSARRPGVASSSAGCGARTTCTSPATSATTTRTPAPMPSLAAA